MRTLAPAIPLLIVMAAADPASAERKQPWRWEGAVGFWLGSVDLATRVDEDTSGFGLGAHFDLGIRRRRWLLTTEFGFLSAKETQRYPMTVPEHELAGGLVGRAGLTARYSLKQHRTYDMFGGDFWFELGVGAQRVRRSDEDRRFSRGDVKLGLGGELNMHRKKFHLGYYYALSVLFTRVEVPSDRPATCAGPCDTATRPIPFEQTFLFSLGFLFGG
jgi:hypothetical protein